MYDVADAIRRVDRPRPTTHRHAGDSTVRRSREHIIRANAVEGIPDLVIAILSPGNWCEDTAGGTKWDLYQRFAVPHYWTVDPKERIVTQYAYESGRYDSPALLGPGDILAFPLSPDITLPVTDLFRNLRPWQ
ncbi:MAG: Uma2 family endonuclease [Chloroflexota bacterium]